MTRPAAPVTSSARAAGEPPGPGRPGIGQAAVLIGALTVVSAVLGLGRQLVFAHTVTAHCLGTAYVTANQVPNVIYDIVLGGALTSIMVPVLARPAQRGQADQAAAAQVTQISSALLSWTVLILVPASLLIAAASGPIATALNPSNPRAGCLHQDLIAVTGRMLVVFAPQVLCYGLAVVLYGILQAHRRFTAPALAPVISSLVVMTAYVLFVPFGGSYRVHLTGLPRSAELILSVGTTLGVVALVVTALVPTLRLHLRLRPTLRFPEGVARQARGLAAYGVAALAAQDAAGLVVIGLANGAGPPGAIALYGYGFQSFFTVFAVLASPIAISAFPVLSASEGPEFDETAAGSARAVLLMSCLGAGLLAAIALPAARVFTEASQVGELARGFAAFAPGLVGFGLSACLSRVLLAAGRTAVAAAAMSGGWLLVIAADLVLVRLVPAHWVVAALGLGNTIGVTVSAVALAVAVRRVRGRGALAGTARAALAGLFGAVAGAAVGAAAAEAIADAMPSGGLIEAGVATVVAAAAAACVFGALAWALDGGELKAAVRRVRRTAPR